MKKNQFGVVLDVVGDGTPIRVLSWQAEKPKNKKMALGNLKCGLEYADDCGLVDDNEWNNSSKFAKVLLNHNLVPQFVDIEDADYFDLVQIDPSNMKSEEYARRFAALAWDGDSDDMLDRVVVAPMDCVICQK